MGASCEEIVELCSDSLKSTVVRRKLDILVILALARRIPVK